MGYQMRTKATNYHESFELNGEGIDRFSAVLYQKLQTDR